MKYFEKIDGLRFIAIILVLVEHFAWNIGPKFSAGYYGVDLFFVISGFLITSILFKTKGNSFGKSYYNFIGRRALRIFPIYYLTILILWIINLDVVRDKLFWLVSYTYNYAWVLFKIPDTPINHFWSLCVEEQYYFFWPFIVLSLRQKPKILLFVIILIIVIGFLQTILNIFPFMSEYNYSNLLTRMSSLGLGSLGAIYSISFKLPEKIFKSKLIEILMLLALFCSLIFSFMLKPLFLAVISLYLVLKAAKFNFSINLINLFLNNKYIVYVGTISYGIYIFHLPLAHYFSKYIFDPIWLSIDFTKLGFFEKIKYNRTLIQLPLYTILSIFVASISFKFVEKPILKLKDKYFNNNDNQNR